MRCGIIGAGLGGLLAGIGLFKGGNDVKIFEKLPYPGGRFTNMEYRGYQLSTGALHMIPHADNGPLAMLLNTLGIDAKIVPSKPHGLFRVNGRDYLSHELLSLFSIKEKVRLTRLMADLKFGSGDDTPYRDWLKKRIDNRLAYKITDSFCGWSLSIDSSRISSNEFIAITKNINRLAGPGIPIGGCKGITDRLVKKFERSGGTIYLKSPVKSINIDDGRATGISTDEGDFDFDIIISNIGHVATVELCGKKNFKKDYIDSLRNVQESAGIKISVGCSKPMLGHSGVLFTPQTERINGLNEVTNTDPSLAPKGKHLLMSHQMLDTRDTGRNVKKEIDLGIEDLYNLFPDFDRYCEILMVQTYRNGWPVNRSASGHYIDPQSPVEGLYYVGDSIKPCGWMETEGVATGVEIALDKILGRGWRLGGG